MHIRVCCVVQYMLSTLTVLPGSATRELQYKIHGPNQPMSAKGKMTVDAVQNLDYLDQCTMAYKGIYPFPIQGRRHSPKRFSSYTLQ